MISMLWRILLASIRSIPGCTVCYGHGCHNLTSIAGPNDINYRYLTEDIPIALACWASIADQLGIETPSWML